jgi:hypothetical protein
MYNTKNKESYNPKRKKWIKSLKKIIEKSIQPHTKNINTKDAELRIIEYTWKGHGIKHEQQHTNALLPGKY